jgi:hypothetical protein
MFVIINVGNISFNANSIYYRPSSAYLQTNNRTNRSDADVPSLGKNILRLGFNTDRNDSKAQQMDNVFFHLFHSALVRNILCSVRLSVKGKAEDAFANTG